MIFSWPVVRKVQRHRKKGRRAKTFSLVGETLEDRRVLAATWQNPIHPLDVNQGFIVSPLDVRVGLSIRCDFGLGATYSGLVAVLRERNVWNALVTAHRSTSC